MDIDQACKTIRRANDAFVYETPLGDLVLDVPEAVETLKAWLEDVRGDGKRIDELAISPPLLLTPGGIRWVMVFVASAETIALHRRRAA